MLVTKINQSLMTKSQMKVICSFLRSDVVMCERIEVKKAADIMTCILVILVAVVWYLL